MRSWGVLLMVLVVGAVGVPLFLGGESAARGLAVELAFVAGWVVGAWALGSLLMGRIAPQVSPALAFASCAGLGLGVFSLVGLGLGLAGVLSGAAVGAMLGGPVLLWVVVNRGRLQAAGGELTWATKSAGGWWLVVPCVAGLGLALAAASVVPGVMWKAGGGGDPHPYDVLSYHLMVPREWYEAAGGTRIRALPHNCFSYFPMNVEVQYLLGMCLRGGVYEAMYFAQYLMLAYAVLAAIAAAGVVRSLGGSAVGGATAFAGVLLVPWTLMLGSVAYVETAVMLYSVLALGWMIRSIRAGPESGGTGWKSPLAAAALAGVFAGLAAGCKYTAIPMTLVLVPVAGLIAAVVARQTKRGLLAAAVALIVGTVVVSPWLIRNAAWTGNPVFPLALETLGKGNFSDVQVRRYELAHSASAQENTPGGRARAVWDKLIVDGQYGYVLLPAGLVGAALMIARRETRGAGVLVITVVGGSLLIWAGATHLQPRFFAPVIPVLAIGLGAGCGMPGGRLRSITGGALVGLMAVTSTWFVAPKLLSLGELLSAGVMFLPDPIAMTGDATREALESGRQVALVGDAAPFLLHPKNGGRLRYCTVFDVPPPLPPTHSAATGEDTWLGERVETLREQGWVLISEPELERMSRTYHGIPPPQFPLRSPHWENESGIVEGGNVILRPTK